MPLPEDHIINSQQDPFGNYLARLVFPEPVRLMSFEVEVYHPFGPPAIFSASRFGWNYWMQRLTEATTCGS